MSEPHQSESEQIRELGACESNHPTGDGNSNPSLHQLNVASANQGKLGLWDAISIIIGIIIGAGIYETPPSIIGMISGPWLTLGIWAIAGLLAFVGALCYAELATAYPRSGGDYVYQSRAYGPLVGFLFGWTQLAVVQTGSIGLMAYVFGDYAVRLVKLDHSFSVFFAAGAIVVIASINMLGVVLGKTTQNILTGVKILGLILILVAGFGFARSSLISPSVDHWGKVTSVNGNKIALKTANGSEEFTVTNKTRIVIGGSDEVKVDDQSRKLRLGDLKAEFAKRTKVKGDFAVKVVTANEQSNEATWIKTKSPPGFSLLAFAMILVFFTYGGWNDAAFVASEVRNRRRNIPRALALGTALVVLVYLLVNAAYINGIGFEQAELSKQIAADTLGLLPGQIGVYGEQLMSLLVMISALGAVNGLIFTSSRIYATMGEDYTLFSILAKWNQKSGVPYWSLIFSMAISVLMVLAVGTEFGQTKLNEVFKYFGLETVSWAGRSGFNSLLRCTAPVFWAFFLLTGLAVFVLRINDRKIPRPFSIPLYPLPPIIFCATCAYLLHSGIGYAGQLGLVGGTLVLAGLPFYVFSRRKNEQSNNKQGNNDETHST